MNELEEELLPPNLKEHGPEQPASRPASPRRVPKTPGSGSASHKVLRQAPTHLVRINSERQRFTSSQPRNFNAVASAIKIEDVNQVNQTMPLTKAGSIEIHSHRDDSRISRFIKSHRELGNAARLISKKKRESQSIFRMTRAVITDTRASSVFKKDTRPKLTDKLLLSKNK